MKHYPGGLVSAVQATIGDAQRSLTTALREERLGFEPGTLGEGITATRLHQDVSREI